MIPTPAPLSTWRAAADGLRLPALDGTRAAVSRLGRGPALRAQRLASIAAGDPCLALELLRAASGATRHRDDAPALEDGIETVSHAVTLIGVEQAVNLVSRLPRLETRDAPRHAGLLDAIATAHVAGGLAERWAERAGRRSPEAHRLAAQACILGDLAAWRTAESAPAAMSAIYRGTSGAQAAEQQALGAGLHEIGAAVSEAWHMPLLVREAFTVEPGGGDRAATPALAALTARAVTGGWHEDATMRALELLAKRLGVEHANALAEVRRGVLDAARTFFDPRLVTAARRLALLAGERVDPEWLVAVPRPRPKARPASAKAAAKPEAAAKPAPVARPETAAKPMPVAKPEAPAKPAPAAKPTVTASSPAPPAARERLKPCLEALAGYAEGKLTVHDTLHGLVRGMREPLGFRRVALAMLSPDRKLLVGRFSSEEDDRQFLSSFRVDMSREHLLSRLMVRQQSVLMDEGNRGQVLPRLPAAVRTLIAEDGFCAMSLFVRDRPVGLLCGHWPGPQAANARRRDYEHFKQLCTRTGRALAKQAA